MFYGELKQYIRKIRKFQSYDESRPNLNGFCLKVHKNRTGTIYVTDGHRMSRIQIGSKIGISSKDYIFSLNEVTGTELRNLAKYPEPNQSPLEWVHQEYSSSYSALVKNVRNGQSIVLEGIEGRYPEVEKIYEIEKKSHQAEIIIETAKMKDFLKVVTAFSKARKVFGSTPAWCGVFLDTTREKYDFKSPESSDNSYIKLNLISDFNHIGPNMDMELHVESGRVFNDFKAKVNCHFLYDSVSTFENDEFLRIKFFSETEPLLIENQSGNMTDLIMPLKQKD